ncbi:hypothetical protein WKR98_23230 [Pigmentiphaga sp. YJ18]|uniref:hypothetical protein n=1 Tax=unclassified Pigmentiphaga TaxID=2626614 RepID=UPI002448CF0D|nr:hypothetical protein [Pigmentiphaga sp. GD03639]MDH2240197.1 hypothetical protein [Pigmentiphaga sp. GD03639]
MTSTLSFIVGMVVGMLFGGTVGVAAACICAAARDTDDARPEGDRADTAAEEDEAFRDIKRQQRRRSEGPKHEPLDQNRCDGEAQQHLDPEAVAEATGEPRSGTKKRYAGSTKERQLDNLGLHNLPPIQATCRVQFTGNTTGEANGCRGGNQSPCGQSAALVERPAFDAERPIAVHHRSTAASRMEGA